MSAQLSASISILHDMVFGLERDVHRLRRELDISENRLQRALAELQLAQQQLAATQQGVRR